MYGYGGTMMGQPSMMMGQPSMMMGQPAVPMVMAAPSPGHIPPGTPPGLEFLLPTHQIAIQQQMEFGEILTGINTNNRYHILDAWGRRMYFAAENSDCASLVCFGNCRAWNINIFNAMGQPVMSGNRDGGCFACCGNTCQVLSSQGLAMGGVIQNCDCCTASWNITDANGNPVLLLRSPCCSACCPGMATCFEAEFPLMTLDGGQQVGKITKHFSGILQEMMTAADTFGVEFPPDLDVRTKATLIYATFLIDFMYYENVPNQNRHHHHHHSHW